jgi:hypothetical protein
MTAAPIFLHSSSRTSSTWLHNKFRVNREFYCYFEIFREVLAALDTVQITDNVHDGWQSNHEKMPPYFLEFLPLVQPEGGVKHADQRFMCERFIPATGINTQLPDDEVIYVQSLLDHAVKQNRQAFLSCTWILGRSGVIKKQFGGTHILLVRDLFTHWCSFAKLYREEHPFLVQMETVFQHNTHDSFIKFLHEYKAREKKMNGHNNHALFTFIFWHLYLYKEAYDSMDVVVYTGQFHDKTYVKETLKKVNALCDTQMDFDNFAAPSDNLFLVQIDDFDLFKDNVDSLFNVLMPNEKTARFAFLTQIKDDFLEKVAAESKKHKTYIKYYNNVLDKSYIKGSISKLGRMVENAIKLSRPALDQLYHNNLSQPIAQPQLPTHLPKLEAENGFFPRDENHMLLGLNFSYPQEDGVWATEGENSILLNLENQGLYDITLRGLFFMPPALNTPIKLDIFLHNQLIKTHLVTRPLPNPAMRRPEHFIVTNHLSPQEIKLQNIQLPHDRANFLVLRFSGCTSPAQLGTGQDKRQLGFLMRRLFIQHKPMQQMAAPPMPLVAPATPAKTFNLADAIKNMRDAA